MIGANMCVCCAEMTFSKDTPHAPQGLVPYGSSLALRRPYLVCLLGQCCVLLMIFVSSRVFVCSTHLVSLYSLLTLYDYVHRL